MPIGDERCRLMHLLPLAFSQKSTVSQLFSFIPHCTLCALTSKKWENIIMRATALKQGGKGKFTAGGTGRNFNTSVLITYDSMWRWVMVYILVSTEGETCRRRRKRENGEKGRQNFMIDIIVCFTLCYVDQREWNILFLPRNSSGD